MVHYMPWAILEVHRVVGNSVWGRYSEEPLSGLLITCVLGLGSVLKLFGETDLDLRCPG